MLKNIANLGEVLNKKEQKGIQGGQFCMIHCLDECISGLAVYSQQGAQNCSQTCTNLAGDQGGGLGW